MKLQHFTHRSRFPVPAEILAAWHEAPGAIDRLTPPWEHAEILEHSGHVRDGARARVRLKVGPVSLEWEMIHEQYVEGRQFQDRQVRGPFAEWIHTHRFLPDGPDASILEDHIRYRLPFGPLGKLLGGSLTHKKLTRLFEYRHRVTGADLGAFSQEKSEPMKIAITGSSGLVGSALVPLLRNRGHQVLHLVRHEPRPGAQEVRWSSDSAVLESEQLEGIHAIIHLAGDNIATQRWSHAKKERLRSSRVGGTKLLVQALSRMKRPPKVMVVASATGFYGNSGDEEVTESSPLGNGFLSQLCEEWEAASEPVKSLGTRLVKLRFGVILSPKGGALQRMLTPFRMGVGGKLGDGAQWMSWLALDDAVGMIEHALVSESLKGPVNAVAPWPVTNAEFTRVLGKVLRRPTMFPVPGFMARLAFGEMADELLLSSTRALPSQLQASGYSFLYPDLEGALRHVLGAESGSHSEQADTQPELQNSVS